jgi:GxxExxY protein
MGIQTPKPISPQLNRVSREIVDSAYRIHNHFGPGLLETVYEKLLVHELEKRGLSVQRQVPVDLEMDGLKIDAGLRLDLLVADEVIVELKSVERFLPVHSAQLLSYLKLSGKRLGLLVNFNVASLKAGIKRMAL